MDRTAAGLNGTCELNAALPDTMRGSCSGMTGTPLLLLPPPPPGVLASPLLRTLSLRPTALPPLAVEKAEPKLALLRTL